MTISQRTPLRENKNEATPAVGIVILTWNGKALTLACLESVVALDYALLDIIVVDNNSTDGTVESVEQAYGDNVHIIVNEENLGFSRGNNIGIRRALERGAEYVLLLNNDTTVGPNLIDGLLSVFATYPGTGVAGPKIYFASPPARIWFAGGKVSLAKGLAKHIGIRQRDLGQFDSVREVDYISGCALMARRDVFAGIGFLDPSYRAYFEDTDFCMRAKRGGFEIRYTPTAVVWHKVSSSTGGQLSRRKIFQKLKSTLRFFGRYSSPYHWVIIPVFFVLDVLHIVLLVLLGRIRNTTDLGNASPRGDA
jgi:GT2 family glycosyltransferase